MVKKYIVRLSEEERSLLWDIVKKLKGTSQKVRRANILLKADVDGPNWSDAKIAEALSCRTKTRKCPTTTRHRRTRRRVEPEKTRNAAETKNP